MEEKYLEKFCASFPFVDEVNGKTILVTGGTGLIGGYILKCLNALTRKNNLRVTIYATTRDLNKAKAKDFDGNIRWLVKDLSDMDGLPDGIDIIFHTACPTQSMYLKNNPVEVINNSIAGAKSLLDYCKANLSCRMVYISSIEIYGQKEDESKLTKEIDYGYLDHLNVRSCYPESKRLIEAMCASYAKEYGVDVTIARLTQTIGADISPNDNRVFVQFARSASKGEDIVLHTEGKSSKSYVHAIDAVNAFFFLAFRGSKGEAYNVANKETYVSIHELANFVAKNFNPLIKVVIDKQEGLGYAPDTKINMDTSKIENLGWNPNVGLREMFSELIGAIGRVA